jgi:hypothetical protein
MKRVEQNSRKLLGTEDWSQKIPTALREAIDHQLRKSDPSGINGMSPQKRGSAVELIRWIRNFSAHGKPTIYSETLANEIVSAFPKLLPGIWVIERDSRK